MKKILTLNAELGTQMQIYLALCDAYRVEIAENSEAVMYYLRKLKPEILLIDHNLDESQSNGRTGADLLRKVKKKYRDLKTVLILEEEDDHLTAQAHKSGADGIMFKPIKNRQLISNIGKLALPTESIPREESLVS